MICANIDHSIQVHITQRRSTNGFVTKMKCEITSNTTHGVLISREIGFKSYKEICSGEKRKVNLGFNTDWYGIKVENNTMIASPSSCGDFAFKYTYEQPFNPCIHGLMPAGKSYPRFSQFTTSNLTGWTVAFHGVGLTRSLEIGLAVWERFEELNIECDD